MDPGIMNSIEAEGKREPFPTNSEEFGQDQRISLDKVTSTYRLEDEIGEEWEWLDNVQKWVPTLDEAMMAKQQEAYRVDGVNEDEPAVDLKKRKAADVEETPGQSKKQKAEAARPERKSNAVYVTSLPDDATVDELKGVFSRYGGVIAESADTGEPRIKIYVDDDGQPKGDALVVFFRPESVQLAIDMLDETEFRPGERSDKGPMRVTVADQSYKQQKDQPLKSDQAKKKGTGANKDRDKIIKKNQELNSRLADWDDDDPQALPDTSSRWDKVVVLKHMFTPEELKADPVAVLDIKEDVREEAEKLGEVTNVVLYDKEEDGTVTVRFSDATAAKACVKVFNGRNFDERTVLAYIFDGKEKFHKSKKPEDRGEDEAKRREGFSAFIEGKEDV
ncbi:hypothetical protein LTR09_002742 [Extremus antarcticus]|uniref:RRM domain-containing protein n=1 Tax=Extremus antarcticus TaxID=702011 RepID=A0AAJ0GEY9_9PEZI|nr:hypothetical protein LTR09_002742 [Extremus antarcticus]